MCDQQQEESFLRAYRSVGVFCDNNQLVLNQTKDKEFLVSSTYKSFKVLSLPSLQVKINGLELKHKIRGIAGQNEQVLVTQKNKILRITHQHIVQQYTGHLVNVTGLLLLGEVLISWDTNATLMVRQIHQYQQQQHLIHQLQDTLLNTLQLDFPIQQVVHPLTYLNKVLVVGSHQIQLVNIRSGKVVYRLREQLRCGEDNRIRWVESSPVVNLLGVGYEDGQVQVLDIKQDSSVLVIKVDIGVVQLAFSREDKAMLAIGDQSGRITIYDLEQHSMLVHWQAHLSGMSSLQFGHHSCLYSSSAQDNHLVQWKYDPHQANPFYLLRQRQGVLAHIQKLKFVDQLGFDILLSTNHSTAFLKNILINNEGFFSQYSVQTKQQKKKKNRENNETQQTIGEIKDFQVSHNNKFHHVLVKVAHSKEYYVFDSQNKRILSRSLDVQKEKEVELLLEQQEYVQQIWVTNCGNYGLIGYNNGLVIKINMQSNLIQSHCSLDKDMCVLVSDLNNTQVAVVTNVQLMRLDLLTLQTLGTTCLPGHVTKGCQAKLNDLLLLAMQDHSLRLYDHHHHCVRTFPGHSSLITDMCFSYDNRHIYSTGHDCCLKVWDILSQKLVNQLEMKKALRCIDVSGDGELMATASVNSRQVDLWHNVLYIKPSSQVLIPAHFYTYQSPTSSYLLDARIYHYHQAAKHNSLNSHHLQNHIHQQKLQELINLDIKEKRDNDDGLVQLTQQEINKWMPLIDLDEIKMKNKIEIKEATDIKLPFFLDFDKKDEIRAQFEQEKADDIAQRSRILQGQKNVHMSEETERLQEFLEGNEKVSGQDVLEYLKGLLPSQVDYQLRQYSLQQVEGLLRLVSEWFDSPQEYDLKSTYFNALLQLAYDSIANSPQARQLLHQIQAKEAKITQTIDAQMLKTICLLEKFTHIKN